MPQSPNSGIKIHDTMYIFENKTVFHNLEFGYINGCSDGSHNCYAYDECINQDGTYTCICNVGYTGNRQTCPGEKIIADFSIHIGNLRTFFSFLLIRVI